MCDIFRAGHGDGELRDAIVAWFKKERNKIVKPDHVRCEGCRGSLEAHWSGDCKMMLYAKRNWFDYCFECEEFPCASVKEFSDDGSPHHKRTVENAKKMREIGIEAWIEEQKKKGQCLFCP
ncbi:DUF3795 domain-containing protein [Candidatus Bathyarchaeota archaeon A05DMB-4]|jgi:hypothetical protein|nr:DUF3795 domain-containing protein [Candidatus Bathyarchaeota archaeon A05DMB-4]